MLVTLPIATVLRVRNPLQNHVWTEFVRPIKPAEVRTTTRRVSYSYNSCPNKWPRWKHIARVAYLLEKGWKDPIQVSLPTTNCEMDIHDGNHRLLAAVVRGDLEVRVKLMEWSENYVVPVTRILDLKEVFG